jgi:hypothetical protein
MPKKSDFNNFLDGFEAAITIAGAIVMASGQIHQALSTLAVEDEKEETIAPPAPQKQLPSARRRRRKNG